MSRWTRKMRMFCSAVVFVNAVFLLGVVSLTEAQEASDVGKAEVKKPVNTRGKLKIEAFFCIGGGIESIKVGITTDGDDIRISGGGGGAGALSLGYGISSLLDIDLTAGYQSNGLTVSSPADRTVVTLTNAEGSFERAFLLVTPKLKKSVSSFGQLKFGVGAGYYMSGKMELDFSEVPDGAHNIYTYDSAIGFHITGEYEHFFSNRAWVMAFGLKYYKVTYELSAFESDGRSVPTELAVDESRDLDGSGVDFTISIGKYF